jgi:transposase InsO family protein
MLKGFKYILRVIDIFSKYAYAVALKNKNASSVVEAMRNIILSFRYGSPKNIHSDQGLELFNKDFKKMMQEYDINHYHTYSKMKASIVERFNRTLKNKIWPNLVYKVPTIGPQFWIIF